MKKLICLMFGHRMDVTGITGQVKWCSRCSHREDVPPAEVIGPDGMTDFSREMHRQWARRDAAMALVREAVAEKIGIQADLIPYLPYDYLTLMAVLGVRVEASKVEAE